MKDITGEKFNKLTAVKFSYMDKYSHSYWEFLCECGIRKEIRRCFVTNENTKSCGKCLQHKLPIKFGKDNPSYRHGLTKTRFYRIYCGIKTRCNNKREKTYFYYGARGVKCLWASFEEFRDGMHESYLKHVEEFGEDNTQIDRVNNNGHYELLNCRWATRKEQMRNMRANKMYTFKGKTQCLTDWANEFGIKRITLRNRLILYKWSIEKSLHTPLWFRNK